MAPTNSPNSAPLARLAPLHGHDRVEILANLLDVCSPNEAEAFGDQLVEITRRGQRSSRAPVALRERLARALGVKKRPSANTRPEVGALAALAAHWDRLPRSTRTAALAAGGSGTHEAAELACADVDSAHRSSLVNFCADTEDPRLCAVLARLCADPEASVATCAQRTLKDFALRVCPRTDTAPVASDEHRDLVEQALAIALAIPPEVRTRVLFAAAIALLDRRTLAARSPSPLARWYALPEARSLQNVIAAPRSPFGRQRAWEWLKDERFHDGAIAKLVSIGQAPTPAEHDSVLSTSHLGLNPRRRCAALGATGTNGHLLPAREDLPLLSQAALAGLPRFSRLCGTDENARSALLTTLLNNDAPAMRQSLVKALPPSGLEDLCYDPAPLIARSAFLHWSIAGELGAGDPLSRRLTFAEDPRRARHLSRCARSPHAAIRSFAKEELGATADLDPAGTLTRLRARRRFARHGTSFLHELAAQVSNGTESTAVLAIQTLRRLSLVGRAEQALIAAAINLARPRVAATAAAALGEIDSQPVRDILAQLLKAPDDRVRANAVESIAHAARTRSTAQLPSVADFESDPHHRVRANALRAAFAESKPDRSAHAADTAGRLAAMIGDDRPMHRLAAAWLGSRLLLARRIDAASKYVRDFTARARELAATDPDLRTRRRAQACVEIADRGTLDGWATAAPQVSGEPA